MHEHPLSMLQRGVYHAHSLYPSLTGATALRVRKAIDVEKLARAWQTVAERHALLRSTYHDGEAAPFRREHPAAELAVLRTVDATGCTEEELFARVAAESSRAIDLTRECTRLVFFTKAPDDHVLLLVLHPIGSDAVSSDTALLELSRAYEGKELATPPIAYDEYVAHESQLLASARGEELRKHWRQALDRASPALELPVDRPRKRLLTGRSATRAFRLPPEVLGQLRAIDERASLFRTLLAAYYVFLFRHTNQTDLVVAAPVSMRTDKRFSGVLGYIVNMLPMRGVLSPAQSFRSWVRQVDALVVDATANRDLPLWHIQQGLAEATGGPVQPYATSFALHRRPFIHGLSGNIIHGAPCRADIGALSGDSYWIPQQHDVADLSVACAEIDGSLYGQMHFDEDLFEPKTMDRMAAHFATLIASCAASPDASLAELRIIDDEERANVVSRWNATSRDFPRSPVHDRVEENARLDANAVAVAFADATLSYGELDARAKQLAERLRSRGVSRGSLVGVCMERSLELPIALLAVLETGAAYVPLDPSYPFERLRMMVEQARPKVVVTNTDIAFDGPERLDLRTDAWRDQRVAVAVRPRAERHAGDLAYVIFTSGSTGVPKGVGVSHGALANCLASFAELTSFSKRSTLLAITPLSFDIAGLELFMPLVTGGTVAIADRESTLDGAALLRLAQKHRATYLQATPATWRMLVDAGLSPSHGLRGLCGGEAVPLDLANALARSTVETWNVYGPTETTIWSTICRLERDAKRVLIGRPIGNTQTYVLDALMQPMPIGLAGELYIGGDGVARGYTRPELTAERFTPDPFGPAGTRLYRTGDLVRWRDDGALEFIGRLDHQVKVRGFRIELGEIETALLKHPAVRQVVVVAHGQGTEKMLVAYVVGDECADDALRTHLKTTLPEYMVPAIFVRLDKLPLSPNGKIDRKALPAPDPSQAQSAYTAPRTPIEEALAAIWSDVLGIARVGIDDDFFSLGGQSLLVTKVVSRVRKELGVELGIRALFERPTIAQLGDAVLALLVARDEAATAALLDEIEAM